MVTREQLELEIAALKAALKNVRRELRDAQYEVAIKEAMRKRAQDTLEEIQRSIPLD